MKEREADNNDYKSEVKNCRKLISEAKGHKEKSIGSRVNDNKKVFFKYIRNKKNSDNGISPLLDGNGRIIHYKAEQEEVFSKFLFYIWGKTDDIVSS